MLTFAPLTGSLVTYTNGSTSVFTGKVVSQSKSYCVIIDPTNAAEVALWNAGFAVGACIAPEQITAVLN